MRFVLPGSPWLPMGLGSGLSSVKGATPPFVFDTFTDTDATVITSHTGERGAVWTLQTGHAPGTASTITGNGLYAPAVPAAYRASGVPSSADYFVECNIDFKTSVASQSAGPAGRMDAAANTMYCARYNVAVGAYQLFKIVAATGTQLGADVVVSFPTGLVKALRLTMVGTTISLSVDGVELLSVTDSAITGAGSAGVRFAGASNAAGTGMHLASVVAQAM